MTNLCTCGHPKDVHRARNSSCRKCDCKSYTPSTTPPPPKLSTMPHAQRLARLEQAMGQVYQELQNLKQGFNGIAQILDKNNLIEVKDVSEQPPEEQPEPKSLTE